jgi:hypothetical protein
MCAFLHHPIKPFIAAPMSVFKRKEKLAKCLAVEQVHLLPHKYVSTLPCHRLFKQSSTAHFTFSLNLELLCNAMNDGEE